MTRPASLLDLFPPTGRGLLGDRLGLATGGLLDDMPPDSWPMATPFGPFNPTAARPDAGDDEPVLTDAEPDPLRAGDQLAVKLLQRGPITFDARTGPPAGGREHARQGPGGDYHFHLLHGQEAGPRISAETFLPLTADDERLYSRKYRQAVERLSEAEKWFLNRATRDVFHTGDWPRARLMEGLARRQMQTPPYAFPRRAD